MASDPKAALNRATDEYRIRWSPETRTTLEQKSMDPQALRAKLEAWSSAHRNLGLVPVGLESQDCANEWLLREGMSR